MTKKAKTLGLNIDEYTSSVTNSEIVVPEDKAEPQPRAGATEALPRARVGKQTTAT